MARFAFYEVVRVLVSAATSKLGVANAEGVVLGIADDQGIGAWYSVLVGGVTYSISEEDLESSSRVLAPEAIYTGESIRADAEGSIFSDNDD